MKAKAIIPFYDFYGIQIDDMNELVNYTDQIKSIERAAYSQLNYYYHDLKELSAFLIECQYASDKSQFNIDDYWMEPVHFENKKQGDCEDFSLFTWKQLIKMGIESRFVVGTVGKNKGHAWCTAIIKGKKYIVEPLMAKAPILPAFTFMNYKPKISVQINDDKLQYYKHYSMNDRGDGIFKFYLIMRGIVIYPVLLVAFLICFIPLYTFGKIKSIHIRYKRKWT